MKNNSPNKTQISQCWDIFCVVVDNFGDIGVCWRLAKQLVNEHKISVKLWVNDLTSFQRLCPEIDPEAPLQFCRSVEVVHWIPESPALQSPNVADVVIEAFACQLPPTYIEAMARSSKKPVWINLEYLSAENWVTECHTMASPHPQYPLTKYFFFPGFVTGTGGLIREHDLLQRRNTFQHDKHLQESFWRLLDIPPKKENELRISLFSYENADLENLIQLWADSERPISALVPEGKTSAQLSQLLKIDLKQANKHIAFGNLSIHLVPFLEQDLYDQLLWSCDLNFVRGEDSFVRAQWAGRPFVWHIYPQDDTAHMVKLDAFLDLYTNGMPAKTAIALRNFWHAWNHGENTMKTWPVFQEQIDTLSSHIGAWVEMLLKNGDISNNLVLFVKNRHNSHCLCS